MTSTVICTECNREVSKYVCTYLTTEHISPCDFHDAENNPLKLFDEILCPNCKDKQ